MQSGLGESRLGGARSASDARLHHKNGASDSVGYPSFVQHLPYLPHAFIVTGEFTQSRRSPMWDVNVVQPIKQPASATSEVFGMSSTCKNSLRAARAFFSCSSVKVRQESCSPISSSNPSCKEIDPI